MSSNPPEKTRQTKGSPMLIVYLAVGTLVTLAVFGTTLILGFSFLASVSLTLLLASPLTFICLLVLNFTLNHNKIDLDAEAVQSFVD